MPMGETVIIGDTTITSEDVVAVARHGALVALSSAAVQRIVRARDWVENMVLENQAVYGITTGLGDLCRVRIEPGSLRDLSRRIVMSHACGVGEPLSDEEVRAIIFCQIVNFAQGHSGVRLELVQTLMAMLNTHVTPWVPSQGSLGYLTHMAHIASVTIGLGQAYVDRVLLPGSVAMQRMNIPVLSLVEKEGLSLVNGTPCMTGLGALAVHDSKLLARWADISAAMSFDALRGLPDALDPRVQAARPFPGQAIVAHNLRGLLYNSNAVGSQREHRVQDPLSLRAIPQVHGACRDQIDQATVTINTELRSSTDNPLLFEDQAGCIAISSCNAHGEPVALAMDQLGMAVSELANISERRQARLVNPQVSGLPGFLICDAGLNTGFMITQYVSASLVAENKVLAHPISVDSITTSALQEDHVSMGTSAALKARRIIKNAQKVIALEILAAAQAMDLHPRDTRFGEGTTAMHNFVRDQIPFRTQDTEFYPDLERVIALVENADPLEVYASCCQSTMISDNIL